MRIESHNKIFVNSKFALIRFKWFLKEKTKKNVYGGWAVKNKYKEDDESKSISLNERKQTQKRDQL